MQPKSQKALLKELNWPMAHVDRQGVLSWAVSMDSRTVATAAVVVTNRLLTLRYRVLEINGPVEVPLEAKWALDQGPYAVFHSLREGGQEQLPDEARALRLFRNYTKLLGGEPTFMRQGLRQTAADMSFPNF